MAADLFISLSIVLTAAIYAGFKIYAAQTKSSCATFCPSAKPAQQRLVSITKKSII